MPRRNHDDVFKIDRRRGTRAAATRGSHADHKQAIWFVQSISFLRCSVLAITERMSGWWLSVCSVTAPSLISCVCRAVVSVAVQSKAGVTLSSAVNYPCCEIVALAAVSSWKVGGTGPALLSTRVL